MPNKSRKHISQYGGKIDLMSTIKETSKNISKQVKAVNDYVQTESTAATKCNKISFWIIFICYLIFNILPFIVIVTSIWYVVDIFGNFVPTSQVDFYEDLLKYREVVKFQQIPFANLYISSFSLTFFIIIIIYVFGLIGLVITYKLRDLDPLNESENTCNHYTSKVTNNLVPSLVFFGIILMILIIDFAVYSKFYEDIGKSYNIFETNVTKVLSTQTDINTNTLNQVILSNTTSNLETVVRTQLGSLGYDENTPYTLDSYEEHKKKDNYTNIVNTYIKYGIVKTIEDNGYHTKQKKTSVQGFFKSDNLFLSINKNTNRLINITYADDMNDFIRSGLSKCTSTPSIKSTDKTILDYVFADCDDIRKDIDNSVLAIKNATDGTTASKIVFLLLLMPLIIITLIYTIFPSNDEGNIDTALSQAEG